MHSTLSLNNSTGALILTNASKVPSNRKAKQFAGTRKDQIIEVARKLMIDEGLSAVTMRRVARESGISPGNLHYHFSNYGLMLGALLDAVLEPYLIKFEALKAESQGNPVTALTAVLEYVLDDLGNKETTTFFPELWVLANRNDKAEQQMGKLYDTYMGVLIGLIKNIRPDLNKKRTKEIALFICASIEGQTVFIGYETTHKQHRKALKKITLTTIMKLVMETD
jgi:AcrR family transcriptional regulator